MKSKYIIVQKKSNILLKINIICCMYIVIWTGIPAFRSATDKGAFRFLFFGVAGIWLLSCFLISSDWMKGMEMALLFSSTYMMFSIFYLIAGYGNENLNLLVSPIFLYLCIFMGIFYSHIDNLKADKALLFCFSACLIITSITTIYNLSINVNYVRTLTSSSSDPMLKATLEAKNVGSFDFVYGNILILPFWLIVLRNIRLPKKIAIIYAICCVLIIYTTLKANFMTLYIFLFISLLFLVVPLNKKSVFIIILLVPLLIVLYPHITQGIVYLLNLAKEATPSIMTQNKITNIILYLQSGGDGNLGEVCVRFTYMKNSLRSFLSSPLIGVGGYYGIPFIIGGHSQFIDDLGRYGLFGTVPLILFMNFYRKKILSYTEDFSLRCACNMSFLFYFIIGILNPIYSYGISMTMFFVVPLLIRMTKRIKSENE